MENFLVVKNLGTEKLFDYVKGLEVSENPKEIPHLLQTPKIKVFGKVCKQNRNVGFFSDESMGYAYSGQIMKSQRLPTVLKKLIQDINTRFETNFNGILINHYRDGTDYIGKHRDDEKGLDTNKRAVASISFGSQRKFRIRNNEGKIVQDIETEHGMFMMMYNDFQKMYTHEIPIQKKVKEPRWSITFRYHRK